MTPWTRIVGGRLPAKVCTAHALYGRNANQKTTENPTQLKYWVQEANSAISAGKLSGKRTNVKEYY